MLMEQDMYYYRNSFLGTAKDWPYPFCRKKCVEENKEPSKQEDVGLDSALSFASRLDSEQLLRISEPWFLHLCQMEGSGEGMRSWCVMCEGPDQGRHPMFTVHQNPVNSFSNLTDVAIFTPLLCHFP